MQLLKYKILRINRNNLKKSLQGLKARTRTTLQGSGQGQGSDPQGKGPGLEIGP